MAKLRIAQAAAEDLEQIFLHGVEQFGRAVASGHRDGFDRIFRLLAEHPFGWRARPDLGQDLRSRTHRSHLIVYRVDGAAVLIVRVLHGTMDAAGRLRDQL